MMQVTPELIPHTEFHKGLWLLSPQQEGWYYFVKRNNPCRIKSDNFINSVDGPLRELVKLLHKNNIGTTPSCAGHHIGERNLESIYESLEKDKQHILNGGLKLEDVQTGNIYLYRDKNYKLPWGRKTFVRKLSSYQHHGIIGMKPGRYRKLKEKLLQIKVKGSDIYEKDGIVFIYVNGNKDHGNEKTWNEITKEIRKILN